MEREFRRELDLRLGRLGFNRSRNLWLRGNYSREVAGTQQFIGIRIEPYLDDLEAEIMNAGVRL